MSEQPPNKVALMLKKEWIELRQQRMLVLGMVLPPLLFVLLSIGLTYAAAHLGDMSQARDLAGASKLMPGFKGMTVREIGQTVIAQQFSVLFLLLPTILPSIIASYSIVGEKTSRTLEPLLATPVTTWELLVAKSLTAVIPAVAITWLVGLVFIINMALTSVSQRVFSTVISPGWVLLIILSAPVLSLIVVALTVAVSARVNDPRSAQQISAVVIVPVMALFGGQISGLLVLSPLLAIIAVLVLGIIAIGLLFLATRLFQRERILTKWT